MSNTEGLTMEDCYIGMKASMTKVISEGDVYIFGGLTGDLNPLHINEDFAKTTRFKTRIAHGLIAVSLIAAVLGSELPGAGSLYVSQEVQFKSPVYFGDEITATLEVIEMDIPGNRLTLKTVCTNQNGKVVVEGTGITMPRKV